MPTTEGSGYIESYNTREKSFFGFSLQENTNKINPETILNTVT